MNEGRQQNARPKAADTADSQSVGHADIRFLLATDSKLLREGFIGMFRHLRDMRLDCVTDTVELLVHCEHAGVPDVLIIEPFMAETVRDCLAERGWHCRILVLWSRPHSGQSEMSRIFSVCGLLRIYSPGSELHAMLRNIARCRYSDAGLCCNWDHCAVRKAVKLPSLPLTKRELDVFQLLGTGESARSIADRLGVSVKTIDSHRENIKRKLELDSAAALHEAAILWRRGEYVGPERRQRQTHEIIRSALSHSRPKSDEDSDSKYAS